MAAPRNSNIKHYCKIQIFLLGLVFNRVQGNIELLKQAAEDLDLTILGYIPQDDEVARLDLIGKPLIELPRNSPAITAVRDITEGIRSMPN